MKQKHSILPLFLSFLSFVFIVVGAVSVLFVQDPLREQSQDIRQQASVDSGLVVLSTTPASGANIPAENQKITFNINTQELQVNGIQLVFSVTTDAQNVTTNLAANSGLQIAYQEVEEISNGYLVSVIALPQTIGQAFSTTTARPFLEVNLVDATGDVTISFDNDNSLSTVYGTIPVRDELNTLTNLSYQIGDSDTVETSPSPSPSASPSTTPTASPTASPSPSPSPTPGTGGAEVKQCNETCSLNSECAVNHRCFNNRCRRADNPDSATCAVPSASTTQAIVKSCNQSCSSNKECAVNLRCYFGSCRLATNPSSMSCSPANKSNASTVLYGLKGEEIIGDENTSGSGTFPSPSPINKATSGGNKDAYTPPATRPSDTPKNALMTFADMLAERGISLSRVGIGLGVILLLLTVLTLWLTRPKRNMPPKVVSTSTPKTTASTYEESLRQKIESLKKQSATTAPESAPLGEKPREASGPAPTPSVTTAPEAPTATPASTPSSASNSSMMQKLRERHVMDRLPNPTLSQTTSSNDQTSSS